jgi:DNA polymerase I-like protein with 3'-5' exonuclease and polymerase domains
MKKLIITPPNYLMSYFDISGAEIRTISFMSHDEFMMESYREGKDPYIEMAKYAFADKGYDEDYLRREWRPLFKMILLGLLYGMSIPKLSQMTGLTEEMSTKLVNDLWKRCPGLKSFIQKKEQWALDHPGYVESALGDILEVGDEEADRLSRLGINQFIQNYSSVSLADGFFHNIEKSIHHTDEKLNAKDFILRPLGVVSYCYLNL